MVPPDGRHFVFITLGRPFFSSSPRIFLPVGPLSWKWKKTIIDFPNMEVYYFWEFSKNTLLIIK